MASEFLAPLAGALRDLVNWWESEQIGGLIIGGVAASLLGRPRMTRDIDALVLVTETNWPHFFASASRFHFTPRVTDALAFARDTRMFLLTHSPSHIEVDISLGALPLEEQALARVKFTEAAGIQLPLPTPEDPIVMKAVAGRPRDLGDIEGILDAHAKLDLRRIRRQTRELAALTERPEIAEHIESLLARRRSQSKKRPRS
jgi:hypothetical protein